MLSLAAQGARISHAAAAGESDARTRALFDWAIVRGQRLVRVWVSVVDEEAHLARMLQLVSCALSAHCPVPARVLVFAGVERLADEMAGSGTICIRGPRLQSTSPLQ